MLSHSWARVRSRDPDTYAGLREEKRKFQREMKGTFEQNKAAEFALQESKDAAAMARYRFSKNFDRNYMTAYQRSMAELDRRKQLFTENLDTRKFNEKRLADDRFTYKELDENGIEQTRVGRYSDFESRATSLLNSISKLKDKKSKKAKFDALSDRDQQLVQARGHFEMGNMEVPGWGESPATKGRVESGGRYMTDRDIPRGGMILNGHYIPPGGAVPWGGWNQQPVAKSLQGSTSKSAVAAARNAMNVPQRVNPTPAIARTTRSSMFDPATSMPVPASPNDSEGVSLSDKPLFNRRIGGMIRFRPSKKPLLERNLWNLLEFAPSGPTNFFSGETSRRLLNTTLSSRRKNSRTQWYNRTLGDYFK